MSNWKHGHKCASGASPEYIAWLNMRARCTNRNRPNYHRYGGRGITLCQRWFDFEKFLADMGERPGPQCSVERIDNDLGYMPGNCRWATTQEQANNRRSSRVIKFRGETLTLAQWARKAGLRIGTLHARLKAGWSMARAITEDTTK